MIVLDGNSLTLEQLNVLSATNGKISLCPKALKKVAASRKVIDECVNSKEPYYGITTGFGVFSKTKIDASNLHELQRRIILSHATGVGKTLDIHVARRMAILRINTMLRGNSGIRVATLKHACTMFNAGLISEIPEQGTVGASGDLAPLAHLALGWCGFGGNIWDPKIQQFCDVHETFEKYGLQKVELRAKEGLAFINGTQFILAHGTEALSVFLTMERVALRFASLTFVALKGHRDALDHKIHDARPHHGQRFIARKMREIVQMKDPIENQDDPQDAYSLRCIPQVHGISTDIGIFVRTILETEMNSSLDNPLIFGDEILSGGNFHGQYPAMALDMLCMAAHNLGQISLMRIVRLMNPHKSNGLPCFLVKNGGLNSGFMTWENTAAALVSENKVMCYPSSADSMSTGADKEDHVSMGGYSARKAIRIVQNLKHILAIEAMAACQALSLRKDEDSAFQLPARVQEDYERFRIPDLDEDRFVQPDLLKLVQKIDDLQVL